MIFQNYFWVKNGVKVGTKKDVGKIFTAVGAGIKNVASDAGNQLLKTKIDKSKITIPLVFKPHLLNLHIPQNSLTTKNLIGGLNFFLQIFRSGNKFPHNELYDLMTTRLSEIKISDDEVKNE